MTRKNLKLGTFSSKNTKKNVNFIWTKRQTVAYNIIRKAICSDKILSCFTGKHKLILEVDGSPVGVGAILLQLENGVEKPICFTSKKLSRAESNYSHTRTAKQTQRYRKSK